MNRLLAWAAQLIQKVLPQQHSTGDAAVQLGRVSGGEVHINNHVHNHHYGTSPAPATAPTPRKATPAHVRVLQKMERLTLQKRSLVLAFMEREFGTRKVVDLLDAQELRRLERYVEVVVKDQNRQLD